MRMRISLLWMLCVALSWSGTSAADDPERPRPSSERAFSLPPWEQTSTSPFGGSRLGGGDDRVFRFLPDGRLILGMDGGGWQFQRFDVSSGASLGPFGQLDDVNGAAVSPSGNVAITIGRSGSVRVWSLEKLRRLRSLDEGVNFTDFGALAFIDERRCLLAGHDDRALSICVWDVDTGEELERCTLPSDSTRGEGRVRAMAVSRAGMLALVEGQRVVLRDRATGQLRGQLAHLSMPSGSESRVDALEFSGSGRQLALAHNSTIHLFDIVTGTEYPPLVAHEGDVRALQFTKDGKQLRSLGDRQVLTWETREIFRAAPAAAPPPVDEVAALLEAAIDDDAWKSYLAIRKLAAAPTEAVKALRAQVKPIEPISAAEMDKILAGLASDSIQDRKVAVRAIAGRADQVHAAIAALDRSRFDRAVGAAERAAARDRSTRLRRLEDRLGNRAREPQEEQQTQQTALLVRIGGDDARQALAEIAGGAPTAKLTVFAQELLKGWPAPVDKTSDKIDAVSCVRLMSDEAAPSAHRAIRYCVEHWDVSRAVVREELLRLAASTTLGEDLREAERLIKLLDDDDFAVREKSVEQLRAMGEAVAPLLRAALADSPSAEAKVRMEPLLAGLKGRRIPPEERLAQRLLETTFLAEGESSTLFGEIGKTAKNAWLLRELKKFQGE